MDKTSDAYIAFLFWMIVSVFFVGIMCYVVAFINVRKKRLEILNIILAIFGCLFVYWPISILIGAMQAILSIGILGLASSVIIFMSIRNRNYKKRIK